MKNKEFEQLSKEVEQWNKLKSDIREKVDIISLDNYDEDSIIFTVLKIKTKKEKDKFIRIINGSQENTFISTFNAMNDYFEKTLKKDYVFIEDISLFHNMFGIVKDRIKSNENSIKEYENQIKKTKNKIVKSKDYDEIQNLKFSIYSDEDNIKENKKTIQLLESIYIQLKSDIKKLESSQ